MSKSAIAIVAHPDDIDLMMGGTLLLLKQAGYETHYLDVANGGLGSMTTDRETTIRIRDAEARAAAAALGAVFHEPLVDDLQIYYTPQLVARMTAIIRQVAPAIVLVQSPRDYMEDHTNSARLGVTAAFCRGMPNFVTDPPTAIATNDVAVYHALPWGLQDQLRATVDAHFFVNIASVIETKRQALACHKSQKQWLDDSQGFDSYLTAMVDMCREMGKRSGKFKLAEGWQRHSHLGYGAEGFDPLGAALSKYVVEAGRKSRPAKKRSPTSRSRSSRKR